jgi:hypothetical protein
MQEVAAIKKPRVRLSAAAQLKAGADVRVMLERAPAFGATMPSFEVFAVS